MLSTLFYCCDKQLIVSVLRKLVRQLQRIQQFVADFREESSDDNSRFLVRHLFTEAYQIDYRDDEIENRNEACA